MAVQSRRRGFRSWFVEPYRQVRLGLMVLLLNLAFASLIFFVFGYYLWDVYSTLASYFDLSQSQGEQVLDKLLLPLAICGGLVFLFIISTILLTVKYTHQIYGPLVSIHRFLDALIEGESVAPLHLRQSDQLQKLAEKLNKLAGQSRSD